MTNAVAYIRVSTEGQAERGLGLEVQREDVERFCEQQGWEVLRVYEDAGVSGATPPPDRPAFADLLTDLEANGIDKVVVARLDRLARDLGGQLWAEKELLVNSVELVSVAEPFRGDDPVAIAFRQIIGVFAELEKRQLVRRLQAGRSAKHRRGGYAGGQTIPYGLRVQGEGDEAVLVANESEALVVKRIYEWRAAGQTLRSIAETLNDKGVPTQQGSQWAAQTVKNVLSNAVYITMGIVTQEQVEKLTAALAGRGGPGCGTAGRS